MQFSFGVNFTSFYIELLGLLMKTIRISQFVLIICESIYFGLCKKYTLILISTLIKDVI